MDDTVMLVAVDTASNHNKFYELSLDGSQVTARWGRVGATGQRKVYPGGLATMARLQRAKERKGYSRVQVATTSSASRTATIARAATTTLAGGNPAAAALIEHLVAVNAHDIGTTSGGRTTVVDGQVTTPLGLLTSRTVDVARTVLNDLRKAAGPSRNTLLERYLTLIPQKVDIRRGWQDRMLVADSEFDAQRTFLDQLQASVDAATAAASGGDGDGPAFRYRLDVETDAKVAQDVAKMYSATANANHGSRVTSARVKTVYRLTCPDDAAFDRVAGRLGNVHRLWHGSRAHNILSILARGMFVPSHGAGIHIAGRMFGNGLYFSDQSTKSALYSAGGMWSAGTDSRWFMFLADVALGWECRPNVHGVTRYNDVLARKVTDSRGGRTFNSISVRGGTCGVRNNEMIVPGPEQVALRYLVEFAS